MVKTSMGKEKTHGIYNWEKNASGPKWKRTRDTSGRQKPIETQKLGTQLSLVLNK